MSAPKTIKWLQLSDLHIFDSSKFIVQKKAFQELAKSLHPDFIVVSGDYRHLKSIPKFDDARHFLEDTVLKEFHLTKKDIYVVPGNHDVKNATPDEIATLNEILNEVDKKSDIDESHMPFLLDRFSEYDQFVKSFYENTGVTDTRSSDPAKIMLFPIENRFNLILLNSVCF